MNTRQADRQKIWDEVKLAQAKLAEYKARPKSLTVEDRIKQNRRIEELEQRVVATTARWQELDEASEDVWRQMKESEEGIWKALQGEIEEAITEA